MRALRLRVCSTHALIFAIILTTPLVFPLSLFLQTGSFSLSLDLDGSAGDQAVQSLDVSPNQDISIQIFGTDIQSANDLSARFEYNVTQVVYAGFDAGDVLPNPDVRLEEGTNPPPVSQQDDTSPVLPPNGTSFVEITMASSHGSATVTSGLVGTIRFRTADGFSGTEIAFVRAELSRNGQGESVILNVRVALQVAVPPSPDFDGSGFVDFQDLSMLTSVYGYQMGQEEYEAKYDLNGDGEIGTEDFLIFIQSYGQWVKHAPIFTLRSPVRLFVDENTPGGEPIGRPISATDADGDMLTYHLSGTDVDLFAIDAGTGQIQTGADITYDYEYRTTYSVIVEVSDGQGGTASLLVIIKINDLKEPPSSPPSNFLVIPGDQSLTVHYAAVPDEHERPPVRGYHAEIRKGEDGSWGDRKTIYGRTNTSVYYHELKVPRYHDPYLINGQLYQVRVRTWNSDGASEWSEPVSGTPIYVLPEAKRFIQFQGEGLSARVEIDLSEVTGAGGKITVEKAALAEGMRDAVVGVLAEVAEVFNVPDVPSEAGFTLSENARFFDIYLKASLSSGDEVDIGGALDVPVEICLPLPAEIAKPVIVHYTDGTWEKLATQRVAGTSICALASHFSLFGVGEAEEAEAPEVKLSFGDQTVGAQSYTVGTAITALELPAAEGDIEAVRYVLTPALPAGLTLSDRTIEGTPTVASDETVYIWKAIDAAGNSIELRFTITVNKTAPGNRAPEFSSAAARRTMSENASGGQAVGAAISATDADNDPLSYSLEGPDADSFAIVKDTGQLQTKAGVTYNYEAKNSYAVSVSVDDGQGGSATIAVTITLTDVDEPPGKPDAPTVSSSTLNSLTITWTAPENMGPDITDYDVQYRLGSSGGFSAWPHDGTSTTATITGLTSNTSYEIQVRAKNAEGTGEWSDSVEGITVQNLAPVFISSASFSVAENIASVGTVTATDADNDDSITDYALSGGADRALFAIASATGELTFQAVPDYEIPADEGENNEYIVEVTVSGGTGARVLTAMQTITVSVTNVNEAPVAVGSIDAVTVTVRGTAVTVDVADKFSDPEGDALTYTATSSADAVAMVSVSGSEVTITPVSAGSVTVTVTARDPDNLNATQQIAVTVQPQPNSAPTFISSATFSVAENQMEVGTVAADDADSGDSITGYTITGGADRALFAITNDDELTFNTAPDYENPVDEVSADPINEVGNNEYIVVVRATSGTGTRALTSDQTITVSVTNVNEAPSMPSAPTVSSSTLNSLTINWTAPENRGPAITDYDVQYRLGSSGGFSAWPHDGTSTTATITGLTSNTSYEIQVRATNNEGSSAWSSSGTGMTVPNQPPTFSETNPTTRMLAENTAAGETIGAPVSAMDSDGGTLTYSLEGTDASSFTIVASSGQLQTTPGVTYNYETKASYGVSVKVEDGQGGSVTIAVTITLTDMNEPPGTPAAPTVSTPTLNSLTITWTAPENTGPAITDYDVQYRLGSSGAFSAWTHDGTSTTATITGLISNTSYEIQVRATNAEGSSAWSSSGTGMTVQNLAPVFSSSTSFSVTENEMGVGTVTASDADVADSITGYALSGGADQALFDIVSTTGVLTFQTAPDYENPTDLVSTDPVNAASNNEYIVVVRATSGTNARALTTDQTITITVTDVNEAPGTPATPTVLTATFNSLTIGWIAPVNTGPSISGYDVRYILSSATDKTADNNWTVTDDAWTSGNLEYTISSLSHSTNYDVQVRAKNDEGTGEWSDSREGMTVQNLAPVFSSSASFSVAENIASVGTVTASDADNDDSITDYALSGGADRALFAIASATGELTFQAVPDYEIPADEGTDNEYIVEVTVSGGTGARVLTAMQTITVSVTNVNEAPVAVGSIDAVTVTVRGTAATVAVADKFSDPEGDALTYTATSSADVVAMVSVSGSEVTITPVSAGSVTVTVTARDAEGSNQSATQDITVTVQPQPNSPPTFSSSATFSVDENIASVGTVVAEDSDIGDSITGYTITGGADRALFAITNDDELTFNTAPDYENPVDEVSTDPINEVGNNEYIVVVRATSGTGARALTSNQTITVSVTNVNEAPVAVGSIDAVTISVGGTAVTVNVADKFSDPEGDALTYTATSSDNAIAMVSVSGSEVTITPVSAGSVTVTVTARDPDNLSATQQIVVTVQPQPNSAPTFSSSTSFSVAENQMEVGTVAADDADSGDSITGYTITGGADRARFAITNDDELTFNTAPDYENPVDEVSADPINAANNNEYIVVVRATSGTGARVLTAMQTITVSVTDVNEAPVAVGSIDAVTVTVRGTAVTVDVADKFSDPEGDALTYTATSSADAVAMVSVSGSEVTITPVSAGSVTVTVTARDADGSNQSATQDITVTAQPQPNSPPTFSSSATFSVDENIASVGTVVAEDSDIGDSITGYTITGGADRALFAITNDDELTFNTAPDYENPVDEVSTDPINEVGNNEYIVVVRATSGTGARALTSDQTITVSVTNVNEAPSMPSAPTVSSSTLNSLTITWTAPENMGPDITDYDVQYRLGSSGGFSAWPHDGTSTTATITGLTSNTSYEIQVRATNNEGSSAWSDSGTGMTVVNQPPTFSDGESTSRTLAENTAAGENIGDPVSATDSDGGTLTYSLAGTDASSFTIVASNGQLQTTSGVTYNYEVKASYAVSVSVDDGQSGSATIAVTITLTDVDEPPGKPDVPTVLTQTLNSLTITWTAPENTGPAITAYDVRYILSSATDKTADNNWTVDEDAWTSGSLEYTISSLSHSTRYDVQVRAENAEGTGEWSDSVAGMTVQNLAPAFSSSNAFDVEEHTTEVGTVMATDADDDDSITGYTITGGVDQDLFAIVSTTGVLSFRTELDYEIPADDNGDNAYIVVVTATSGTNARVMTSDQSITVSVTDVNEAPVFSSSATFSVAENIASVGTVAAADADNDDSITDYALSGGADRARFEIVSATGELTFQAVPDYENPADEGENNEYIVEVTVSGGTGARVLTAMQTITVSVTDVNEAPVAVGSIDAVTVTVRGTAVTVDVADKFSDPEGDALTYTATSSADAVAMVSVSGSEVTITPVSAGSVTVTVTARDADGSNQSATQDITVTAQPQPNSPPTFSSSATFSVDENIASVGTVVAEDSDIGDSITGYTITGGADRAQFAITNNGVLTFQDAPDYENPTDLVSTDPVNAARNNEYIVVVTATSGTGARVLTAVQPITVSVTDVNEPPGTPSAPTVSSSTLNSLTITWTAPENMGPDITDYDVQYRLGSSGGFSAWTHDGTSTTATITGLTSNTSYEIQVRATNNEGSSAWSSSGTGMTVVNQPPTFSETNPTTRMLAENTAAGETIGAPVSATDSDGGTLTYSLEGTDASSFTIVASNGQLQTTSSVTYNYETKASYGVSVKVEDGQGGSVTIAVTITLTDVNEPPGTPDVPTVSTPTLNSLTITWTAPENMGPDITDYDVQYRLGSSGGFSAWTHDGTSTTATITGLTSNTSYEIQVRATNNEGSSAWSSSGTGMTVVNQPPTFSETNPTTRMLAENTAAGETIGAPVSATDSDGGTLTYSLEGTDASSFTIVASNGQLQTTSSVTYNYETKASYGVSVKVEDGQGGSVTIAVTITLTDVDEPPGKPAAPTVSTPTLNSLTITWTASENTGPAITAYDVRHIRTDAPDKADANWTVTDNAWTSGSLEYTISSLSHSTRYDVQVRAENAEGTGDWSDSVAGMTVQNLAPAFSSRNAFDVEENTTEVGTVMAADADDDDSITGYTITGGVDRARFAIVSMTGVLSFQTEPDYEIPADNNGDNEYIVVVTATSGTGARVMTSDQSITVSVTDVNEAPVFISSTSFSVDENIASVGTVVAEDSDSGDSITGYTITGGADRALFAITNDDELTFNTAPDYENPVDEVSTDPINEVGNNEYIVVVRATGGTGARALTSDQSITVSVTNVDEPPGTPAAPTVSTPTLNSLTITWTAPENTGPAITDYDVQYRLGSSGDFSAWIHDGTSTTATITGLISNTSYEIQVRATNNEGSSAWSSSGTGMTLPAPPGICGRTEAVRTGILSLIDGVSDCALVTNEHLNEITELLDLQDQSITTLQANDFSGLSSLEELSLDRNELSELPAGVFSGLSNLQELRLDRNELSELPAGVFSGLSNLQVLRLARNELSELPAGVFSGLSNLQVLRLERIELSALPDGVFSGLSSLENLHLQNNELSALPDGVFSGLSSLETLYLQNNSGSDFILTLELERTDNANLIVVRVAEGAPFNMTVTLTATGGTLMDMNSDPIEEAKISKGDTESGPITVMQSGMSGTTVSLGMKPAVPDNYRGIQTAVGPSLVLLPSSGICGRTEAVRTGILSLIDGVSDCALVTNEHLSEITGTLDIHDRDITALQANDFSDLSNLQTLSLYRNSLNTLPADVFSDLSNLQTLSLDNNSLTELSTGVFTGLSSLQTLHLDENSLNTLPADVFSNLSNLQTLSLDDNSLTELSTGVFTGLSSLQTLSLDDNSLTELSTGVFTGLSSLQILHLNGNSLNTLPADVFSNLSNLQILRLDNNSLTELSTDVFTGLSSLQTLSLKYGNLTELPAGVFAGLSNLQELLLDNNALTELPAGVFAGSSSLRILRLDNNALTELPAGVFAGSSNLQELLLDNNALTALPAGVFSGLSSLNRLNLSGNTGSDFTLTLQLKRTDNADLTTPGPATIVVEVVEGTPFDMTANLTATGGTLTSTEATIKAGSIRSDAITVTQTGTTPVEVRLVGSAPRAPVNYDGIRAARGNSLVLFGVLANREPETLGTIDDVTLTEGSAAETVDVASKFRDPDNDMLTYSASASVQGVATVSVSGSVVTITPVAAGITSITVTAMDSGLLTATQTFSLTVKNLAPTVNAGLIDATALLNTEFTYTFSQNAFQDKDQDELTYTSKGQPAWLTFTSATRTFMGTPSDTQGSPFDITVTADDGNGGRVQATFTLTVPIGICGRTLKVQTAILSVIDDINACGLVTEAHLAGIVDVLNLRNQDIMTLQANDFSGLSNLRILNLYNNALDELPPDVFADLSQLRFLSLYSNSLDELPPDVFADLSQLRFLSLDGNDLTTLPTGVFSNLSNLRTLSLLNNKLGERLPDAFAGLSNLQELLLDNNVLSELPDGVFADLSSLQTLHLNDNALVALPAGVFSGLSSPGLSRLDLSDNLDSPGSDFTLTLQLRRTDTDNADLAGPATIVVEVVEGAPFDMTVTLTATGGTLTAMNGNTVTQARISAGSTRSDAITVTQTGTTPVTVSLGSAPPPPSLYEGLQTAVGNQLVLF